MRCWGYRWRGGGSAVVDPTGVRKLCVSYGLTVSGGSFLRPYGQRRVLGAGFVKSLTAGNVGVIRSRLFPMRGCPSRGVGTERACAVPAYSGFLHGCAIAPWHDRMKLAPGEERKYEIFTCRW